MPTGYRKTQAQYIEECEIVHGKGIFNYSKVFYTRGKDKITIICPNGHEFSQIAQEHLNGHGCQKCTGLKKFTQEEFEAIGTEIHKGKYSYAKARYINSSTKVTIICDCGYEFEQTPNSHLQGYGCKKCAGQYSPTTEEWKKMAIDIHGNDYGYDEVEYKNSDTKVKIWCNKHEEFFWQNPGNHITLGHGCKKCAIEENANRNRFTTDEVVEYFIEIHGDKYDYCDVDYKNNRTPVKIFCKKHKIYFEQSPCVHLRGCGCPICRSSQGELRITETLQKLNIYYKPQYKNDTCRNINELPFDFAILKNNEVLFLIEYQGEQHFRPVDFYGRPHEDSIEAFAYTLKTDKIKNDWCSASGIKLLKISYYDYKTIEEILIKHLENYHD